MVNNPISRHVYFHVDTVFSMSVYASVDSPVQDPESNSIVYDETRSINKPEIFDLGYVEAGETIRIKVNVAAKDGGRFKISAAALDEAVYTETMETLATGNLEIGSYNSRLVSGRVTADEAGVLFLSIPYDESWIATVNGVEQEVINVAKGLSGVELPAGTHDIVLKYTPPGFWIGVILSLFGVMIFLIALLIWRNLAGKRREQEKRASLALRQRREIETRARLGGVQEVWRQSRVEHNTIRTTNLPDNERLDKASAAPAQTPESAAAEMVAYHEQEQASHSGSIGTAFPELDECEKPAIAEESDRSDDVAADKNELNDSSPSE